MLRNKRRSASTTRTSLGCVLLLLVALQVPSHAEQFAIAIGDSVSDGVPSLGAGRLSESTEEDIYSFVASAGQLAFFEPVEQEPGLRGRLRWQLLRPNGSIIFGGFFSNPVGRTLLPDAGTYRIRVYTDGTDPNWIGTYSFRTLAIPPDQTFSYTVGATVSDGVPSAGAGRLEVSGAEDYYTFTAAAGQLAFFEALDQDAAFGGRLRWQLIGPTGTQIFGSFFSNPIGRVALPTAGEYRIRNYTDATNPNWFGAYSFRSITIPPDQNFDYTIGTVVSEDAPASGAGKLEVVGSEDSYVFSGTAGQLLFFRSLGQAAEFRQNLRWQLIAPNGNTVFSSFFTNPIGRTELPQTGVYRLRIFTDAINSEWFGAYSFQISPLGADQTFAYTIGTVIADGVPAVGAGRLEAAGAEDYYTFMGTENQVIFFESLNQDAAFKQALRWQLIRPSGGNVFSAFFTNPQGRTVLPESGEYRIRVFTGATDPELFGTYSFRTRGDVLDQQFTMEVGDVISDGKPSPGAGNLETPGSTDTYSFSGRAGQEVIFESLTQAPAFQINLRWELLKPTGGTVFSFLFSSPPNRIRLPEAGVYRLRVFTSGDNPTWVGAYSFRTYTEVSAYPDQIATRPGEAIEVTFDKFLFNDLANDPTDDLSLELLSAVSEQGNDLSLVSNAIRYAPKVGFVGMDRFGYRLLGSLGGTNETIVTVNVAADVGTFATVVNSVRTASGANFCLLGAPSAAYGIEASIDLLHWTPDGSLTMDATGGAIFELQATAAPPLRYFRARKK